MKVMFTNEELLAMLKQLEEMSKELCGCSATPESDREGVAFDASILRHALSRFGSLEIDIDGDPLEFLSKERSAPESRANESRAKLVTGSVVGRPRYRRGSQAYRIVEVLEKFVGEQITIKTLANLANVPKANTASFVSRLIRYGDVEWVRAGMIRVRRSKVEVQRLG